VGQDGAHLRIALSESRVQRAGIFFRAGHLAEKLPEDVDTLYSPKLNTFMGRTSVQLELKAVKSGDIMSEIDAKIKEERLLQHDFLTDMLYNKGINFFEGPCRGLDLPGLKSLMESSPQGTLVLTADLAQTRAIAAALDASPDLFVREAPDDPRAFNALCCYPPDALPGCYRRVVLAGMPDCPALPEGTEVFRMDLSAPWRGELPDVDRLREVYKQIRGLSGRLIDSFDLLTHHLSRLTGLSDVGCAAALLALHDLKLIELEFAPFRLNTCKMHKTDPNTSAVWRAVQAWRT